MTAPDTHVKNPFQPTLDGSEVLEIILRVGVIRDADHVQFMLETRDVLTGELIQALSRIHVDLESAQDELEQWVSRLRFELWNCTGPF